MTIPGFFRSAVPLALILLALVAPSTAQADGLRPLALNWMVTNDRWGDGRDRWRTGSYTLSVIMGRAPLDTLPAALGRVWEFRLDAEISAPDNLDLSEPDRRYAGVLTFGAHTHFQALGGTARAGAGLGLVGPITGLDEVQGVLHDISGGPPPPLDEDQIGNSVLPMVSGEWGRAVALNPWVEARPFAEAQAGVESFLRAGLDLTLGGPGPILTARDPVTGFRHPVRPGDRSARVVLDLGADAAWVADSLILRDAPGGVSRLRARARAGVRLDLGRAWVFFGATWLGAETDGQPSGQSLGSISANIRF